MNFKKYITEKTNKFNISWQIVRVNARSIKDVDDKVRYVLSFLKENPNKYNYDRVHNWLSMTKLGYKSNPQAVAVFDNAIESIEQHKNDRFSSDEDSPNILSEIPTKDLERVYKDLKQRKYGFQFKSIPQAHINFLDELQKELAKRQSD
jgi:hypothetical protein